jgi:hypothetical protein
MTIESGIIDHPKKGSLKMVQYIEMIFLSLRTQLCYVESEDWNVLILQTVAS